MKNRWVASLLLLSIWSCTPPESTDFTSIFDGETWIGWEGSKDFFRIEEGAIVAGSLDTIIPKNQFLCTEAVYGDFELQLKVKFASTENNAGVQFRTSRIPNHHEVIGYQADVGFLPDRPIWGSLYDESRRKVFLKEADHEAVLSAINREGWNDYRIYCKGPQLKFWLNNTLVLEYEETDEKIARDGVVCVQIHSGSPAEAWYKDIKIQQL